MKKAILLSLIFYGYQFLAAMLFIAANLLTGAEQPMTLGANALSLSSLLSCLLVTGHLLYCRDATFRLRSFAEVRPAWLLWCLPMTLSATFLLNVVIQLLDIPDWGEAAFNMMGHNPFGILAMVVAAPFAEELLFRGAIEGHLLRKGRGAVRSILLSSLLFGIVHGNPAQMPFAFLLGLLLGWLYYRTGSILPGVFCHMVNNGLAVLLMHVAPGRDVQEVAPDMPVALQMAAAALLLAASLLYAARRLPRPEQEAA